MATRNAPNKSLYFVQDAGVAIAVLGKHRLHLLSLLKTSPAVERVLSHHHHINPICRHGIQTDFERDYFLILEVV